MEKNYYKFEELSDDTKELVLKSVSHYLENIGVFPTKAAIKEEAESAYYDRNGNFLCRRYEV